MIIKSIGTGTKVKYGLSGNILTIGDDNPITIDLSTRQQNDYVSIDISRDPEGNLVEGVSSHYVATIEIPGRKYKQVPGTDISPTGETVDVMVNEPIPFNPDTVKLNLWNDGV